MRPDLRRIVAVEAHRRRSGRIPSRVHSLGTGETFAIEPADDGFVDVATGMTIRNRGSAIVLPDGSEPIELTLIGDILFEGIERPGGEPFFGRAGGGSSVTLYDRTQNDYFQYALGTEEDRI